MLLFLAPCYIPHIVGMARGKLRQPVLSFTLLPQGGKKNINPSSEGETNPRTKHDTESGSQITY